MKELSKLTIKVFHIDKVLFSDKTYIEKHTLYIRDDYSNLLGLDEYNDVIKMNVSIVKPCERNRFTNSIMDIIPISTKVLGKIGEGITHTLTGVCVCLTGVCEDGTQVAEFGSSEGILSEKMIYDTEGTPNYDDIIVIVDFLLKKQMGTDRKTITSLHYLCDEIIQEIRNSMKKLNGRFCDEKHEYIDLYDENLLDVVVVKQIAGQGAMYDMQVLADEPSGMKGGKSIIDLGNVPIMLTANEYRDGAIRAMC